MMGEKEHQEIAESCNRLIKNSIIFWNYLYLELRLKKENIIDQETILTVTKAHSPISWAILTF
jgi:TnpA family transposase